MTSWSWPRRPVETAGTSFSLTVTAQKSSGATDTGYLGTIHFTSSDIQAGMPANFTFTVGDDGTHTFTVMLKTAGSQSVSATDTATPAITGTLSGISVSPAAASRFVLSGLPSSVTEGVAQAVTVTAVDPYANVATNYTGTVRFTSSDTEANLSPNYTFTIGNQGVHSFTLKLETAARQSVTVTDTTAGITATQSGIMVGLAAPTSLVAHAVSATQINLTWTGSNGATGYLIQQSPNGNTGWSLVGSTSGGTTTFQKTGLTAAATYYYRVLATLGNVESAYSNVANATTSERTVATIDSIWSNSYVPSENANSNGSYEVGVKFTAGVAGEVTGVRFYKQIDMGGYIHIGHLWASTGKLLSTAVFTNESASGWQQVTFSSAVAIQANTVYIVSFSTGGGYFGITTNFFTRGGLTNGPLQALSNSIFGGDGVYNRAGVFPNVDGNGMNFWADIAFTPTSSSSNGPKASSPTSPPIAMGAIGPSDLTTDHADCLSTPAPARPARYIAGSRDNSQIPGLVVLSPSNSAGRVAGVLAQEVVIGIGVRLRSDCEYSGSAVPVPIHSEASRGSSKGSCATAWIWSWANARN